jgi:hypothetical protein
MCILLIQRIEHKHFNVHILVLYPKYFVSKVVLLPLIIYCAQSLLVHLPLIAIRGQLFPCSEMVTNHDLRGLLALYSGSWSIFVHLSLFCVVLLLLIANHGQSLFTYRDLRGPLAQQESGTARKDSASPVKFWTTKMISAASSPPSPVAFAIYHIQHIVGKLAHDIPYTIYKLI